MSPLRRVPSKANHAITKVRFLRLRPRRTARILAFVSSEAVLPVCVARNLALVASDITTPKLAALNLARVSSEVFLPSSAWRSFSFVSFDRWVPVCAVLIFARVSSETGCPKRVFLVFAFTSSGRLCQAAIILARFCSRSSTVRVAALNRIRALVSSECFRPVWLWLIFARVAALGTIPARGLPATGHILNSGVSVLITFCSCVRHRQAGQKCSTDMAKASSPCLLKDRCNNRLWCRPARRSLRCCCKRCFKLVDEPT